MVILHFPAQSTEILMRVSFQKKPNAEKEEMSWHGEENYSLSVRQKYRMPTRENSRSEWERVPRTERKARGTHGDRVEIVTSGK